MKKIFATLMVSTLLLMNMSTTVFAHGHRGTTGPETTYALCTVENCNTAGNHSHDGTTYGGHYTGDGHTHNAGHSGGHH